MNNSQTVQKFSDDGYIKFQCEHIQADWNSLKLPLTQNQLLLIKELDIFRTQIFDQGFIGIYENGIGYGNLSHRFNNAFIITASATGGARELGIDGYTFVPHVNIDQNKVTSIGPLPASSETMSHATIYTHAPKVQCVLHIHNLTLFNALIEQNALSTPPSIPYGTIEMAYAIKDIVKKHPLEACIVMKGHLEGILLYGLNINHVASQLAFICQEIKQKQCNTCKKGDKND